MRVDSTSAVKYIQVIDNGARYLIVLWILTGLLHMTSILQKSQLLALCTPPRPAAS